MQIYFATKNEIKYKNVKQLLDSVQPNLVLKNIFSYNVSLPKENGNCEKENAVLKSQHYYSILREPLFCEDSGIYFNNHNQLQPKHEVKKKPQATHQNLFSFWSAYIAKKQISFGKLVKVFSFQFPKSKKVKEVQIPLKFYPTRTKPPQKDNPFNYLMGPVYASKPFYQLTSKERLKFRKKYLGPIFKQLPFYHLT